MKKLYFNLSKVFILLLVSLSSYKAEAQFDADSMFNAVTNNMNKEFETFRSKNQKLFDDFVAKNDAAFAKILVNGFKEYNLLKGKKAPSDPKPKDLPKVDPLVVKNNKPDVITVEIPKDTVKPKVNPNTPTIQRDEPEDFSTDKSLFKFYGAELGIVYDQSFVRSVGASISPEVIGGFWTKMSATNHYHFINQLLDYKTRLNLNDWGYLMLVQAASKRIAPESLSTQNLLTWFFMVKSRYKVKIGYTKDNVQLLIPSLQMIYGKPYYTFNDIRYFAMDDGVGAISTYNSDYGDAQMALDLDISSSISLGTKTTDRPVSFEFEGKTYSFTLKYNTNEVDFFQDYPQCDMKVFFDAAISSEAKESFIENLKPLIQGKSQFDAANLLLTFVQTAFQYKTDDQQFGREKFFFAEEVLRFPYCDCEDRSVLYSYLIRELMGLEVVGLGYPGHMASAVNFTEELGRDYFMFKDKKFTICDPTYIGAPVGMCMPQFINVKGQPIELANRESNLASKKKIWEKVFAFGGSKGGNNKDLIYDKDGNVYVAGYFFGEAAFGGAKLASGKHNEAFLAKFNKSGEVVWAKQAQSSGNSAANSVSLDRDGNVFISGTYANSMSIGGASLQAEAGSDVFVAKYSPEGAVLWANKLDISEKPKTDVIYVSRLDNQSGKQGSILQFEQSENFNNYGISIAPDGSCIVTAAYSNNGGDLVTSKDIKVESSASFNHTEVWQEEFDKLKADNYESAIAGLFAFMKTMKVSETSVSGKSIQDAMDKMNPDFKKKCNTIYSNIGKLNLIKNAGGIVTISTNDGQPVALDALKLSNNSKIKITSYPGGNAKVDVLNGASIGKAMIRFDLNYIKLIKNNGDLVFDYDSDHQQKTVNLKRDILKY